MNGIILDKDYILKEVDLLQATITRISSYSFLLKGWYFSIISLIIGGLNYKLLNDELILVLLLPILGFWYLNAYYLFLERLFRGKYEWVINHRINGNGDFLFDLNPHNSLMIFSSSGRKFTFLSSFFSIPFIFIYVVPLAIVVLKFLFILGSETNG